MSYNVSSGEQKITFDDLNTTERDVLTHTARIQSRKEAAEPQEVISEIQDRYSRTTEQTVYNAIDSLYDDYGCLEKVENECSDARKGCKYIVSERGMAFIHQISTQYQDINNVLFEIQSDSEPQSHSQPSCDSSESGRGEPQTDSQGFNAGGV